LRVNRLALKRPTNAQAHLKGPTGLNAMELVWGMSAKLEWAARKLTVAKGGNWPL
jgi:hypothetical protein